MDMENEPSGSPSSAEDDLGLDPSYTTSPRNTPPRLYITAKNIYWPSSVPTVVAEKLRSVCPSTHVERCLITNECQPSKAIEKAHLLLRATPVQRLRQLEYAWGMSPNTLNVDSTSNLFYLRADLHRSFDAGDWALVPSIETLTKITNDTDTFVEKHSQRPNYLTIMPNLPPGQFWTYKFVPIKLLRQDVTIFRRNLAEPTETPASSESPPTSQIQPSHQCYNNPYTEFPSLMSHVHPYFVIVNAGENFRNNRSFVITIPSLKEIWMHLIHIWVDWTSEPPKTFLSPLGPLSGDFSGGDKSNDGADDNDGGGNASTRKLRPCVTTIGKSTLSKETAMHPMRKRGVTKRANQPKRVAKRSKLAGVDEPDKMSDGSRMTPISPLLLVDGNFSESPITYPDSMDDWSRGVAEALSKTNIPLLNTEDSGVMQYAKERGCPPRKNSWHSWRTNWTIDPVKDSPIKSEFSSNDWVVYHHMRYLPIEPLPSDIQRYEMDEQNRAMCNDSDSGWEFGTVGMEGKML